MFICALFRGDFHVTVLDKSLILLPNPLVAAINYPHSHAFFNPNIIRHSAFNFGHAFNTNSLP